MDRRCHHNCKSLSVDAKKYKTNNKTMPVVEVTRTKQSPVYVNDELNDRTSTTTISCLPVELLALVIRHLDIPCWSKLELVDSHFRAAVLAAWRRLRSLKLADFFGCSCGDGPLLLHKKFLEGNRLTNLLETLFARSPLITELNGLSSFWDYLSADIVCAVTANFSKLRSVDLGRPSSLENSLPNLIKLKNLRELTVIGAFDDQSLISVLSAIGRQLTLLKIPDSWRVSDHGILASIEYLHNLRHLNLDKSNISDYSLNALAESCPELSCLIVSKCMFIRSRGLKAVVDSCLKLVELCFCETQANPYLMNRYGNTSYSVEAVDMDLEVCCMTRNRVRLIVDPCYFGMYDLELRLAGL